MRSPSLRPTFSQSSLVHRRLAAKRLLRPTLCVALALVLGGLVGCANVKPWERDALAREDMSWDPDPQWSQLQSHIHFSKEAGMPGNTGGGGGCGCN